MVSKREMLGMPRQEQTLQKVRELREQEEFLNDIIALLLDKEFFSEKKYMLAMERKEGIRKFLREIIREAYLDEKLSRKIKEITGEHKERLLLILEIDETSI